MRSLNPEQVLEPTCESGLALTAVYLHPCSLTLINSNPEQVLELHEILPVRLNEISVVQIIDRAMRRTYKEDGKRVDLIRQQRFDVEELTEIVILNHEPRKEFLCELVIGPSPEDIPVAKLVSLSVLQIEMIEPRLYNEPVKGFDRPVYTEFHHVSRERNSFVSRDRPSSENPKTAPD